MKVITFAECAYKRLFPLNINFNLSGGLNMH